jgi:hypothetical protein
MNGLAEHTKHLQDELMQTMWTIWDYYDCSKPLCYCTSREHASVIAEIMEHRVPGIVVIGPGEFDLSKFDEKAYGRKHPAIVSMRVGGLE